MARQCTVTGSKALVGNKVSHANNKTKRRFLLNLQQASFLSEALNRVVQMRVSTKGLRTIEHKGGLDAYLLSSPAASLSKQARILKKQVQQALNAQA